MVDNDVKSKEILNEIMYIVGERFEYKNIISFQFMYNTFYMTNKIT